MAITTPAADDVLDLLAAYGVEELPTAQSVELFIDKAVGLLPSRLEEWISQGLVSAEAAVSVVEDIVVRVLRNPQALRAFSIDDFSATVDAAISGGRLYLSPEERARLTPVALRSGRRLRSVRVAMSPWVSP